MTSTDLIVAPLTGVVIPRDATTDQVAEFIEHLDELASQIAAARSDAEQIALDHMDAERLWTAHVGGFTLTAPSDADDVTYDGPGLFRALTPFVKDGTITYGALRRAITPVITFKPKVKGIEALDKIGGKVAETIAAHRTRTPKTSRKVKVTRGGA